MVWIRRSALAATAAALLIILLAACNEASPTTTTSTAAAASVTSTGEPATETPTTTTIAPSTTATTESAPGWEVIVPQLEEPTLPEGADPTEISYPRPVLHQVVFDGETVLGLGIANSTFAVWGSADLEHWDLLHQETFAHNCPEEMVDLITTAGVTETGRLIVFTNAQQPCGTNDGRYVAVFLSDDHGNTWAQGEFAGRPDAYIWDFLAEDNVLYAVGHSGTTPTPAIWTSHDNGNSWGDTTAPPEAFPEDTGVGSVLSLNGSIVAVGRHDFVVNTWTSRDRGETWERHVISEVDAVGYETSTDGRLVLIGEHWDEESATRTLHAGISSDGVVFEWGDLDPEFGDYIQYVYLAPWGESLVALTEIMERSDPQYCFQDVNTCQQKSTVVNIGGADGWQRLAAAGSDDLPNRFIQMSIVDGQIVGLGDWEGFGGQDQKIWMWDLEAESATVDITAPTTTMPPYPIHDRSEPLEVGVIERFVFTYAGCGADHLVIAGENWKRIEVAEPDETWIMSELDFYSGLTKLLYATITLTEDNRIEARLETGEVIAVYEPTDDPVTSCY